MSALLLSLLPLLATAQAEPYAMNDVGGSIELPAGWQPVENSWADWEIKAKSRDNVHMHLWLTPFQVEPTEEAVNVWTGMYADGLRGEGLQDVKATSFEVSTLEDGRTVGRVVLEFKIDGGGKGVGHFAAIPAAGQVVHIRTIGGSRVAKKVAKGLDELIAGFTLDKGPLDVQTGRLESSAGFAATLPEGWRAPLGKEMEAVREISAKVGENLDPDDCWVAIKPPPIGEVDLIWACQAEVHLPPVDEYSFEGVEAEVHDRYFGRSDKPVPHAEQVNIGDRVGFYYRPPVADLAVRLAISPYNGGQVVMWGFAGNLDESGLDAAMQAVLPTVEYTAEGGGQPIIGADKWLMHYLKYRTFSPAVLCPTLACGGVSLALVVLVLGRGRKNKYEDI